MPAKYPSNHSPERIDDIGESGATCPCGCGYFQEGEFKVCPCGCGTVVEIVDDDYDDDGDLDGIRAGG